MPAPVDYDQIAPTYDERYRSGAALTGVTAALKLVAEEGGAQSVLEVGCGTGRWILELSKVAPRVVGLDRSAGMLRRARAERGREAVARGDAAALPFARGAFDLVVCVNALHHFPAPQAFLAEARRVLRGGGEVAFVGLDPHDGRDHWYLYDYFPTALETDRARFPSAATIGVWLHEAGFERIAYREADRITRAHEGRTVLDDRFLRREQTSQLVLLSDENYAAGLRAIEEAVAAGEARGVQARFEVDLTFWMTTARAR